MFDNYDDADDDRRTARTTSGDRTTDASIWFLERGLPDQSGGDVIAMLMSGGTRKQLGWHPFQLATAHVEEEVPTLPAPSPPTSTEVPTLISRHPGF